MDKLEAVKRTDVEMEELTVLATNIFLARYEEDFHSDSDKTWYSRKSRARARAEHLIEHCLSRPVTADG